MVEEGEREGGGDKKRATLPCSVDRTELALIGFRGKARPPSLTVIILFSVLTAKPPRGKASYL